jgi:hypothetical protein
MVTHPPTCYLRKAIPVFSLSRERDEPVGQIADSTAYSGVSRPLRTLSLPQEARGLIN